MANYRDYMEAIARGMAWASPGTLGERLLGFYALMADTIAEAASEAIRAPWLQTHTPVPEDALAELGAEYNMPRYPGETNAQYKARLQGKWDAWEFAGNESAILAQLTAFGLPDAEIYTPRDWSARPPINHPVTDTPWWSRFWVVIPDGSHSVGVARTYGDGSTYGNPLDPFVYGADMAPGLALALRQLLNQWKPGHVVCAEVIFEIGGETYGTGHTYGEPGLVYGGDTAVINC
jgi:hypothetical protein